MPHDPIPFSSPHFSLHRLADGVFAAIATQGGAAVSNAGIIDLGDRTLVFDTFLTPQAGRDLRLAAQHVTGRDPSLVINSHYHNDHIWGNQAFSPDALFISTAQTHRLIQTDGREEVKWAQSVSASRLEQARGDHEAAADEVARHDALLWMGYFGGLVEDLPSLAVRFPDVTFDGTLSIHGLSRSVDIIPFENSHTGNDTILLLRDLGIVFTADVLFVGCHPYLEEANTSALAATLHTLSGLGASVFVPGHGPVGDAEDIESNLQYLSMCTAVAERLVASGDSSAERIAREKPPEPFADWGLARFFTANLESLCARLSAPKASG